MSFVSYINQIGWLAKCDDDDDRQTISEIRSSCLWCLTMNHSVWIHKQLKWSEVVRLLDWTEICAPRHALSALAMLWPPNRVKSAWPSIRAMPYAEFHPCNGFSEMHDSMTDVDSDIVQDWLTHANTHTDRHRGMEGEGETESESERERETVVEALWLVFMNPFGVNKSP